MKNITRIAASLAILSAMSMAQTLVTVNGTAITQEDVDKELMTATQGRLDQVPADKHVNIITPALFKKYPDAQALSKADIDDVKSLIQSCSFFNNKAKNILEMAKRVVEVYGGEIPMNEKELITLAGVGQKTANVVMIEYTGANLMAVDTHVFRVSHRLGLSDDTSAIKTEATLVKKFKNDLHALHQGMVLFGRYICKAKNPKCDECFLTKYCKSKESFKV